jgi:hypothetical protein
MVTPSVVKGSSDMKNIILKKCVIIAVVFALGLLYSPLATAADGIDLTNAHYIFLTPGHSKTISYDLNWGQVHTAVVHLFGLVFKTDQGGAPVNPTFKFSAAVTDSIGEGSELVFATTGFVGLVDHILLAADETFTQKIASSFFINYSYSSDTVSASREIPAMPFSGGSIKGILAAQAILVTGFVLPIGDPDFPVTMSMRFSLD